MDVLIGYPEIEHGVVLIGLGDDYMVIRLK